MTPYFIFSAADAKELGWVPQSGDEYLSQQDLVWRPISASDPTFEVESINRRPVCQLIHVADQLAANQQLQNDVLKLSIQVEQMRKELEAVKQELKIINPLS